MRDATESPSGTITFLFTDIEGSTRRWEDEPDGMQVGLVEHDAALRDVIVNRRGVVFKHTGDGVAAAFTSARDAVGAAIDAQAALDLLPFRARMGLHTGEADQRDGDFFGPAVNRAARLMAVAHGGQVVCSEATAALVLDSTLLTDLGVHRLRDLTRPEHVFQVGGERFPPLRSMSAFPGNLPVQLTSLVGRQAELQQVAGAVGDHRVVTLTGVGGVGKTRLALHVAAELVTSFAHGAWLVELAPVTDDAMLSHALASSLGVKARYGLSVEASVEEFLRDKQMLLVLDNCEHLLDAVAMLVERIMRGCSEVRVLATSREGLGTDGEQVWPLRSLQPGTDGAALFWDRARSVVPDLEVTPGDADAAAEICRRLDGIPLAIELAAARVTSLAPSDIAERLDARFRLLTGGRRTAVERHQTLRAAVDWSYGLLDAKTRRVFDGLAVFAGGFTLAAAEAVVADDDIEPFEVLDTLSGLVTKSMLIADTLPDGTRRYRLLETLRQYGQERLERAGAADRWRRRHAEHYADFVTRAARGWQSPDEQVWRQRLARELDNLRAGVSWAVGAEDADLAARLVGPLVYQAWFYSAWGIDALARSTLATRRIDEQPLFASLLGCVAFGAWQRGDQRDAVALSDQAIEAGQTPGIAPCPWAYQPKAWVLAFLGDLDAMQAVEADAVAVARRIGDHFQLTMTLSTLTSGAASARDTKATASALAELSALDVRRTVGPEVRALVAFGVAMALAEHDTQAAIAALEEARSLARPTGSSITLAWALPVLSALTAQAGNAEQALEVAHDAIVNAQETGDREALVFALSWVAVGLTALGRTESAAVLFAVADAGTLAGRLVSAGWFGDRINQAKQDIADRLSPAELHQTQRHAAEMSIVDVVTYALEIVGQDGADDAQPAASQ